MQSKNKRCTRENQHQDDPIEKIRIKEENDYKGRKIDARWRNRRESDNYKEAGYEENRRILVG